jgi:hypothetical protein
MSSKPGAVSPAIGLERKIEKAAGIRRLLLHSIHSVLRG